MSTRAALFDLDRTLLDCNSGRLWAAHEWREGNIGLRDVAWAGYWLTRYHLGMSAGMEAVLETAVASVAGESDATLQARTDAWFDAECAPRLRPGAVAALARHRDAGHRVVLATSSTLYVAHAAQRHWGFADLICTRLEVVDGLATGRIETLAYGDAKLTETARWADACGIALADCTFYTDSITDLALLDAVGEPIVVNPDRPLARLAVQRSWPTVDWGTSTGARS